MESDKVHPIFKEFESCLICPVCGASFRVTSKSLICENHHCFDIAAKGYVNFLLNQKRKSKNYSKKLFENRAKVFAAGAYKVVIDELCDVIAANFGENRAIRLLDAGCGEGYFAANLNDMQGVDVCALDIVKDAIIVACGKKTSIKWMVADITNIPLRAKSMDVILNVLAIANYDEFKRILSRDGMVVKVVPGRSYLKEIRDIVKPQLYNKEYSNESVVKYFESQLKLSEKREICYKFPTDGKLAECFAEMTPLTAGLMTEESKWEALSEITIHLEIMVGKA